MQRIDRFLDDNLLYMMYTVDNSVYASWSCIIPYSMPPLGSLNLTNFHARLASVQHDCSVLGKGDGYAEGIK